MPSRIFLLTGMTPDRRIYERLLPLLPTASIVDWIAPQPNESIRSYTHRLAKSLPEAESTIVCGVSFGGIAARELAHALNAKGCVLISSVRAPRELPPWLRMFRLFATPGLDCTLNAVGRLAAVCPRKIRTRTTWKLTRFGGAAGAWHRWATSVVLGWKPKAELDRIPLVQIHGDCDETFPIAFIRADVIIRGGGHVLPLTHCQVIAAELSRMAA